MPRSNTTEERAMHAIADKRLSVMHWRVLAAIAKSDARRIHRHEGTPCYTEIAQWIDAPRPLVKRTIHELIEFGYLAVEEVAGQKSYRVLV